MRAHHAMRQLLSTRNVFITSKYASRMLPKEGRFREFVVNNPVRDELFSAQAGLGARLDGQPIRHPAKERLVDCVVEVIGRRFLFMGGV